MSLLHTSLEKEIPQSRNHVIEQKSTLKHFLPPNEIFQRAYHEQFFPYLNRSKSFGQHYVVDKFRFAFAYAPVIFSAYFGITGFAMFPLHGIAPPLALITAVVTANINYRYFTRKYELIFKGIEYEDEVETKMFENFHKFRKTDLYVALLGCVNIFTGVYAFHYRRLISHFNDYYSKDFRVRKVSGFKTWNWSYRMIYTLRRYYFPFAFAVPYVLYMEYANARENIRLKDHLMAFQYKRSEQTVPVFYNPPPEWAKNLEKEEGEEEEEVYDFDRNEVKVQPEITPDVLAEDYYN